MSDFLRSMASSSAERAASIRHAFTAKDFDLPIAPFKAGTFEIIAEIKERSPSAGVLSSPIAARTTPSERARQYRLGGAAAISVLTEPARFGGDMSHLREVAAAVPGTPVMRKDFLVDARQVLEARAAGASGVLLIAAILDDAELADMLDCAFEHSLFVLLESFDRDDVARTVRLLDVARYADKAANDELLLGVNSRNLRTLEVEPARLAGFAPMFPADTIAVAESGLAEPRDAAEVSSLGYRVALVGTALMRAENPAALVSEMLAAGRAAANTRQGVTS
jgi:indole-3-glycerol phosphate synthase